MQTILWIALLFVLLAGNVAGEPPTADPYGIFARARIALQEHVQRSLIQYTVVTRVVENKVPKVNHYVSEYDPATDKISVDAVSQEEREHPHVPPGGFVFFGIPVGGREEPPDHLGVPVLTPTYTFGLIPWRPPYQGDDEVIAQIRARYPDPMKSHAFSRTPELKVIGEVQNAASIYSIALIGVEGYGGHADYHLALKPLKDPHRFRLRQAWIDVRDFGLDRIVTEGNFTGPSDETLWTISFRRVGVERFIETESTGSALRMFHRTYENVSVSFENIHQIPVRIHLDHLDFSAPFKIQEPG